MKKTLMVLICLVSLMGIVLCGCNNHKHTFDTSKWEYNATSHWHRATCEHTDVKGDEGAHEFDGNICKVCKYDKTAAVEHKHDASTLLKVERKDATCTADGTEQHYKCKQCGKLFDSIGGKEITEADVVIPAKGHDKTLVHHREVVPTCTTEGVKENWECKSCGQRFDAETGGSDHEIDDVTLPVNPENHLKALKRVKAKEADCANEGNIAYYECTDCRAKYSEDDGKTEHKLEESAIVIPKNNVHDKLEHVAAKTATCTEDGNVEYYKCPRCNSCFTKEVGGDKIDDVVVKDPYNHEGGKIELVPTVYATQCGQKGVAEHYTCTKCHKLFSDPEGHRMILSTSDLDTEPLEHVYKNNLAVPEGSKGHKRVCDRCGQFEKDINGNDLIREHNSVGGVCYECGLDYNHTCATGDRDNLGYHSSKNSTCTENGNIAYYECSECHQKFADPYGNEPLDVVELPLAAHTWTIQHNETEHWLKCDMCGKEDGRTKHIIRGGVCESSDNAQEFLDLIDGCGYGSPEEDETSGLIFGEENGAYYVRGIIEGNRKMDITIPATFKNKNVVGIHSGAFAGKNLDRALVLDSLTIPTSITTIRAGAFNLAYIPFIWYLGGIDDWNKVTVEGNNSGLNFCDNLYIKCTNEPAATVYGLFYKDKDTFYKHVNPADMPTYGVIYEKIEGTNEYQVTGIDRSYFAGRSYPWIVKIHETFNGVPVTKIVSIKLYRTDDPLNPNEEVNGSNLIRVVLPKSILDIGVSSDDIFPITGLGLYYYNGTKEDRDKLNETTSAHNVFINNIAYYSKEDPQATVDGDKYWYYDKYDMPQLWTPSTQTGGVKLNAYNEQNEMIERKRKEGSWDQYDETEEEFWQRVSYWAVSGVEDDSGNLINKIVIPEKYKEKPVTKIENLFNSFKPNTEYVIIPESIKEFMSRDGQNEEWNTFSNLPDVKILYAGDKEAFDAIEGSTGAFKENLYNSSYNQVVYFFSEDEPEEKGYYWHYDKDDTTPVIWEKTSSGDVIPEDIVIKDDFRYVISPELDEYYVAEYLGSGYSTYVEIEDEINGLPVTKLLNKLFMNKFENLERKFIFPESIDEIMCFNGSGANKKPLAMFKQTSPMYILLKGENATEFMTADGVTSCGITADMVYTLIGQDEEPDEEGRYWKYDEDGYAQFYVKVPEHTYTDQYGYTYEYFPDKLEATIIDYKLGGEAVIKLPESVTIDGKEYTVTAIGKEAFINAKRVEGTETIGLKGIIFNKTIKTVGERAFYNLGTVEYVVFTDAIESIGTGAFYCRDERNTGGADRGLRSAFTKNGTNQQNVKAIFYIDGDSATWSKIVNGFYDWSHTYTYQSGWGYVTDSLGSSQGNSISILYLKNDQWKYDTNGYPAQELATAEPYAKINGVTYKYNRENKTFEIYSVSGATNGNFKIADKLTIFDNKDNSDVYNLTEIPASKFSGAASVIVPEGVKTIRANAFSGVAYVIIGDGQSDRTIEEGAFVSNNKVLYTGTKDKFEANEKLKTAADGRTIYYYSETKIEEGWHYSDDIKTIPTLSYEKEIPTSGEWLDRSNFVKYSYSDATNSAKVISYDGPVNAAVVIPEKINVNGKDYTVTEIGAGAFSPNYMSSLHNKIKSIVLPKTVTKFGTNAFYTNNDYGYEASMEFFVMGAVTPGTYSIRYALSLQGRIYFRGTTKEEVESMRSMSGYYDAAIPYIYKETEPTIDDYTGANRYCRYWHFADKYETQPVAWHEKEIVVDGLKYTCNTVTKEATLWGGSVPFDNAQKKFILKVKDYVTIGVEKFKVTEIAQSAFNGTTKAAVSGQILDEIELPDTIERIGKRAFYEQYKVKKMIIGDVKTIESDAFTGCFHQTETVEIYFHGSKEQFTSFLNVEGSFKKTISETYTDEFRDKITIYYYSESEKTDNEYGIWKYGADGKIEIVQKFPEKNE